MPNCKFTTKYFDYDLKIEFDFYCDDDEPLASGFCIFHDKDYLQDRTNYEEHKRKVLDRLKRKVNHAISNNEALLCIGFQLPEFSLSDLGIISKEFTKPVYFSRVNFQQEADFSGAKFQAKANFIEVTFQQEAFFHAANFQGDADFNKADFQQAHFQQANFQGRAFFRANFQRDAYFIKTNFQETADFQLFAIWIMVGSPLRITSPPKTRR